VADRPFRRGARGRTDCGVPRLRRVVVLRRADALPERRRRDALGRPMFSLENRVAVVTGAASGIGAATAQVFATAGADVVLGWFPGDPHDVQLVRDAVEETGRRALVVEVDVSSSEQVDAL